MQAGDAPDVLVAFNPAALKVSLPLLDHGALVIVNNDAFTARNLAKAGYDTVVNYRGDAAGAQETLDRVKAEGRDGKVLGFDVDPAKVEALMAGRSYIGHIPDEQVAEREHVGPFFEHESSRPLEARGARSRGRAPSTSGRGCR